MYSKQEASLIRKTFWTNLGQYMKPVMNAEGEIINWLNYKTGIKHIFFRMDADHKRASIGIELTHPDAIQREQQYRQFNDLKTMFAGTMGEEWQWEKERKDEHGRTVSRIGTELNHVNIFEKADWPAIISFLKPRIIALDRFWTMVKDDFD